MKNIYIPAGYRLLGFNTEDYSMKDVKDAMINARIDYAYYVAEDGEFVHNGKTLAVKTGDVVFVLYGQTRANGGRNEETAAVILKDEEYKAYIIESHLAEIELNRSREVDNACIAKCEDCVTCDKLL